MTCIKIGVGLILSICVVMWVIVPTVIELWKARSVQLGDIWEDACPNKRTPPGPALYEVVAHNDCSESHPDSWQMRHIRGKHELYMHHAARMSGQWRLIRRGSWHSLRAKQLLRPAMTI